MGEKSQLIKASWPASSRIRAFTTTRKGGSSLSVYQSLNLAMHVSDKAQLVRANRQKLQHLLPAHCTPYWLNQTHGNQCVKYDENQLEPAADASFSNLPNQVLVVMTADCLPILLTDRAGQWIAACHAGWRGLADGVIENTVSCYSGAPSDLIAWIGPAISQPYFEVGVEVREKFIANNADFQQFFEPNQNQRFQLDFISLAKQLLNQLGVEVFGGEHCSYHDKKRFYSYRRDGQTGRMASLIWIEGNK